MNPRTATMLALLSAACSETNPPDATDASTNLDATAGRATDGASISTRCEAALHPHPPVIASDPLCADLPDLRIVHTFHCPGACNYPFYFQIGNTGARSLDAEVLVTLVRDLMFGGTEMVGAHPLHLALGPGEVTDPVEWTLPGPLYASSVIVDDANVVPECDEDNNSAEPVIGTGLCSHRFRI